MVKDRFYEQRKVAIHLLRSGLTKPQVASQLNRSYAWVCMCWNRYKSNKDFRSLRSHSRAAKYNPRKLNEEICREIKIARSELEAEKAEGESKVSIGAKGVQDRLAAKGLKNIPSTRSIERILRQAGMSLTRRVKNKPIKYPPLKRTLSNRVSQDSKWVLKLLQGKIGFAQLSERLSEKLDTKEIQKLLDYVL
ncbi:MAG: hypothetical protein L0Z71_14205, partial [Anaerolineae bacterium]|nr:hypothetical protein [Anaerolineae bacterium]